MLRRLDENTLSHGHKNEENDLQAVKNDNIRETKLTAPTKSPARRPVNTGLRDRENRQTPSKSRVLDVHRAALTPTTPTKNTKKPYVFKDPLKSLNQLPLKRKKDELLKKNLKDESEVSAGISSPVRKKLDLGPVDEYEVEYAPPRAQDELYQPDFSIDLSPFTSTPDARAYEMNHITDLDTITTHSKEKEGDNFVDLLFKSLDRNSETLDVTSEVSPSAAIESSFLPEIDQSEIEYAPQREEELPYRPEFEIDLSIIPQEPNYAVYEFGHLLDVPSSITILFEEDEEGQTDRFPQDEFEFVFGSEDIPNDLDDDQVIRVPFDDFQFDVNALSA
ncbi:hypothetical protein BC943DRAFT_380273 [Umbelopsis sp. AD052]|nr:hypothetical protein BC943DRAFT_380273 [Umbelopsis sp. AD052]